ncbi:MAG: PEGA domain-containing protein [Candidatus Falkowbacteria bacterium]
MTKRIRNILFIIFTVAFIALSAVILTYAFGYSLSPYGFKLQKTGIFDIESTPSAAQVSLNGEVQKKFLNQLTGKNAPVTTPIKIAGILPGDYEVKLTLNGYHPWQKKLTLNASETTYLENVRLFKETLPQLVWSLDITRLLTTAVSPDKKYWTILTDNQVIITNLADGSQTASFDLPASSDQADLSWSNDSQSLIANHSLINLASGKTADLRQLANSSAERFVFGADSSQRIYFLDNGSLYEFDILANTKKILLKPEKNNPFIDFLAKDGYLYAIKQNQKDFHSFVAIYKLSDSQFIGTIDLNNLSDYRFTNIHNRWLNLYDQKNHALYLLDIKYPFNNQYELKRLDNAYFNQWDQNNRLLLAGQSDLRLWQRSDNKETLLTRLGTPIRAAFWYKDDNYLIFATDNSLGALELDDRNGRQHTNLLDNIPLTQPQLNADGSTIFFFAKVGQTAGLYSLSLE